MAAIAARQRGYVTTPQPRAAGLSHAAIRHRRLSGRLHRIAERLRVVTVADTLAALRRSGSTRELADATDAAVLRRLVPPPAGGLTRSAAERLLLRRLAQAKLGPEDERPPACL